MLELFLNFRRCTCLTAVAILLLFMISCSSPKQQRPNSKTPKSLQVPNLVPEGDDFSTVAGPNRDQNLPDGKVVWVQDAEKWRSAPLGDAKDDHPGFRILYLRVPREFGCVRLESGAFMDQEVLAFLGTNAVCRFLSMEQADSISRLYGIRDVPALVVLDGDGALVGSIVGLRTPVRLLEELQQLQKSAKELSIRAAQADEKIAQAKSKALIEALDEAAALATERRLLKKAAHYLEQLVHHPEASEARALPVELVRWAEIKAALGESDLADDIFERALKADLLGMYTELNAFRRARARMLNNRHKEAVALWVAFEKEYPESRYVEIAAYNQVYALLQAGRTEEAAKKLNSMIERAGKLEIELDERIDKLQGHVRLLEDADKTEAYARMLEEARLRRDRLREHLGASRALLYSSGQYEDALKSVRAEEGQRQYLADALSDGRDLVRKYACHDCHEYIEPLQRAASNACVQCHLLIKRLDKEEDRHDELLSSNPHFFRNCQRIQHILRAPNLFSVGARVRPDWLHSYLANPFDVRPHLEDSMIRINYDEDEVDKLVRYFRAIAVLAGQSPPQEEEIEAEAKLAPGRIDPAEVKKGERVFVDQKCFMCHEFGNVRYGEGQGTSGWEGGRAEAPNLRFVRDRLLKRTAREWVRDPQSMSPQTRMPQFRLKEEELDAVIEYLFHGHPGPAYQPKQTAAPVVVKVPTWDEVNAAVFRNTCIHCHHADHEGGAGNVGAYGFAARRLDLTSYFGIRRGALQPDGKRIDILRSRAGGRPPLLLERIRRREEENQRDFIKPYEDPLTNLIQTPKEKARPGMPLGHPALKPEEIALLEAWINAGAPGPEAKPLDGD